MFYTFPFVLPLAHRFGSRALRTITLVVAGWSLLTCLVFSMPMLKTFDEEHQKRFFALHTENVSPYSLFLKIFVTECDG